jgi:GcrA cell cycle regulator
MDEQFTPLDTPLALHENYIGPPAAPADYFALPEAQSAFEAPVRRPAKKKLITTLTLTSDTCRWPFGDPAASDFHYCGQLPQTAGPYCDTHESMSRPSGQRRKSG